jgi:peptidoglycan/xylan/chitin deacetylase (PgdA/CDA1 family)
MRRCLFRRTSVFLALAVPFALAPALQVSVSTPASAATNTVVSLTFDDGQASQAATQSMLASRGMAGTYYINSAQVGTSGYYMTWPQIHALADAGNEIGGHTLHHVNLTNVSATTAQTEVCQDRQNLLNQGFSPVSSFAYPEAAVNATAKQVVQQCGYTSGRGVGNIYSDGPYAETVPPGDAFELDTPDGITTGTTVSDLQSYVTNAENNGGGWVIFTFHGICNNTCTNQNSMTTSTFTAFLDWLQTRSANGTVVRTVGEVMGSGPGPGTTPSTSISCNGATCSSGWYRQSSVSVALTATGGTGSLTTRYTTDGTDPRTSPTATTYSGPFAVTATRTIRYFTTGDSGAAETPKSQTIQIDAAPPSAALTSPAAGTYRRGTTLTVAASATDNGTGGGAPSGISQVVFRDGTTQLGTDTTAPYQIAWRIRTNTPLGNHSLTAVATDAAGNSATSAPVIVNVIKR